MHEKQLLAMNYGYYSVIYMNCGYLLDVSVKIGY